MSNIRIPFFLLLFKPGYNFQYIDHTDSFKKPTDLISSLSPEVLNLLGDRAGTGVTLKFLLLSDAKSWACGSIGSYFEQFKSLTNLQADVGKWTNCDQEKTFKDAKIQNLVDEDVGDKLMARLIVIATPVSQAYAATITSLPTITEDVVKGIDRQTIINLAKRRDPPSTGAQNKFFMETQQSGKPDVAYNYTPLILAPPPISIYEPAFARFKDRLTQPIENFELSYEDFRKAYQIIEVSSDLFENEDERRKKLEMLNILDEKTFWTEGRVSISGSCIIPDGRVTEFWEAMVLVFLVISELKNSMGEGGCCPSRQVQQCYIKVVSADEYEQLRCLSCCPAFLIGQAGNVLIIWGAVFADGFFFQPLAQVYLGPMSYKGGHQARSGIDQSVREVAKIFHILKLGVQELKDHYKSVKRPKPIDAPRSRSNRTKSNNAKSPTAAANRSGRAAIEHMSPGHFPRWNSFQSKDHKTHTIQYIRRLTHFPEKAVFQAKMMSEAEDGVDVVVKFAYQYCKEAHELLAALGLAPKLYYASYVGSEEANGPGMWIIVMAYLDGSSRSFEYATIDQKRKLMLAVCSLRRHGFAHGDLRKPNIFLREADELFLLDFDWCGLEGAEGVEYPMDIIVDEFDWHDTVGPGRPILMEHDEYRLRRLLKADYDLLKAGCDVSM